MTELWGYVIMYLINKTSGDDMRQVEVYFQDKLINTTTLHDFMSHNDEHLIHGYNIILEYLDLNDTCFIPRINVTVKRIK